MLHGSCRKPQSRFSECPIFPRPWFVSGQWEVAVLAELLCTAGAAKGGDDLILPRKGSVSIPAKENAAEAMKGKLKGNQNGNNTVSEDPTIPTISWKSSHRWSCLKRKEEKKRNRLFFPTHPQMDTSCLLAVDPHLPIRMPFSCPFFRPTPSLCPANLTFLHWARSWIHLSGSGGAECGCRVKRSAMTVQVRYWWMWSDTKTTIPQIFPSTDSYQGQVSPAFPTSTPSCEASVLCCLLNFGPEIGSFECYKEADNLFPQGFHCNEGSGLRPWEGIWDFPK